MRILGDRLFKRSLQPIKRLGRIHRLAKNILHFDQACLLAGVGRVGPGTVSVHLQSRQTQVLSGQNHFAAAGPAEQIERNVGNRAATLDQRMFQTSQRIKVTTDQIAHHHHAGFRRVILLHHQVIQCVGVEQRNPFVIGNAVKYDIFIGIRTEGRPQVRLNSFIMQNFHRTADRDDDRLALSFFQQVNIFVERRPRRHHDRRHALHPVQ